MARTTQDKPSDERTTGAKDATGARGAVGAAGRGSRVSKGVGGAANVGGAGGAELAARFLSTRAAHRAERAEDYVEAVAALRDAHGRARVTDLARMMGVSHVTVSRTIARLAREGLVVQRAHRPIALTPAGERLARGARERHEVVLRFLLSIGVSPQQAELDSEGIEHHVSRETIRAMKRAVS